MQQNYQHAVKRHGNSLQEMTAYNFLPISNVLFAPMALHKFARSWSWPGSPIIRALSCSLVTCNQQHVHEHSYTTICALHDLYLSIINIRAQKLSIASSHLHKFFLCGVLPQRIIEYIFMQSIAASVTLGYQSWCCVGHLCWNLAKKLMIKHIRRKAMDHFDAHCFKIKLRSKKTIYDTDMYNNEYLLPIQALTKPSAMFWKKLCNYDS